MDEVGEAIAGVLAAAGAEVVIGDIDEPGGRRRRVLHHGPDAHGGRRLDPRLMAILV